MNFICIRRKKLQSIEASQLSAFLKMEKVEYRAVIKFLTKEGIAPGEINERLQVVYGTNAPSYSTVKFWARQFKCGRESLDDDPRSGRPVEVTGDDMVEKVEDLIMENNRLTKKQLAGILNISTDSVLRILHEKLDMNRVSCRWVPRMLTVENKRQRRAAAIEFLDMCKADPDKFFRRIVTCDETWIHYYDPETKQQSMQWQRRGERAPIKFKTQPSAGKIMASIFWDAEGILLIDYLPNKTTVTGVYYASLIEKLREAILQKRRGLIRRGVLFLQDNAPAHRSQVAMAALANSCFKVLTHPPYSPDLAPSDYFLFPNLKKELKGQRFESDEEIQNAVSWFFEGKDQNWFYQGIAALKNRYEKCIEVRGDYVEK